MSFPKAKIHRFNDEIPCAPPPGTYNPEVISKVVGPIINKTERFSENKSIFHATPSFDVLDYSIDKEKEACNKQTDPFKTPKIPSNVYKFKYNTEGKRNSSYSQKSTSSDFISRRKTNLNLDISTLKQLQEIQDKLHTEEDKSSQLLEEIYKLKEICCQKDIDLSSLLEVIDTKSDLIVLLKEKYLILENITSKNFKSYAKHVFNIFTMFESYSQICSESETKYCEIVQRYEDIIAEYENDFQEFLSYLTELLLKNNYIAVQEFIASGSLDEDKSELMKLLEFTEKEKKKYESAIQETRKVICILSQRILDNDDKVQKSTQTICIMEKEIENLCSTVQFKDEEIIALRAIINTLTISFLNELQITQKELMDLIDTFKKEALLEKSNRENLIVEKDKIIAELLNNKNQNELKYQEALDQIDILKCKEETLSEIIEQFRNEKLEKYLESSVQHYDDVTENKKAKSCTGEKTNINEKIDLDIRKYRTKLNLSNLDLQNDDLIPFFENLIEEFLNSSNRKSILTLDTSTSDSTVETQQTEINDIFKESEIINVDGLKQQLKIIFTEDKFQLLRYLLLFIYRIFNNFKTENFVLRNELSQITGNFVEKCGECSELTHLLQISENRAEYAEKKIIELELLQNEWEMKNFELITEIKELKREKSYLDIGKTDFTFLTSDDTVTEYLSDESKYNRKSTEEVSSILFKNQLKQLEDLLTEERSKTDSLEKENSKLRNLIGPFRQQLENFKEENKGDIFSDSDVIERYTRLIDHQNYKQKIRQIVKLRNENTQLKKKNEELLTEINKYRKNALKIGKENKICLKSKTLQELKSALPDVSVNSTYIVTSPKVNRI